LARINSKKINSVKFYHVDPRNILEDVNSIPELFYLATLTTPMNSRSKFTPELSILIGQEAYSKLINFFGGTSVYIPTKEELQSNLLGVMSYYYYNVKGLTWVETMKKLGITPTKGNRRLIRNRWKAFKQVIESDENKIPELPRVEEHPEIKESEAPVKCDDIYIPKETFLKVVNKVLSDLKELNLAIDGTSFSDEDFIKRILDIYE
jgi:hypothetical protein